MDNIPDVTKAVEATRNIIDATRKWGDVGTDGAKKLLGLSEIPFFRSKGAIPNPYTGPIKVNPNSIRYSQDSISNKFSDGDLLSEAIAGLKNGTILRSDFPPIKVFKRGDEIFSVDNRRLKVFQEVGIDVKTVSISLDELTMSIKKLTTTNDGVSVRVRNGGL